MRRKNIVNVFTNPMRKAFFKFCAAKSKAKYKTWRKCLQPTLLTDDKFPYYGKQKYTNINKGDLKFKLEVTV